MQQTVALFLIIAVIVVWLFLRDWRATLVAAAALPLSVVPAFAVMYLFHFSINVVTLLSLSLVVGILVDDAIVEIENIMRHLRMGKTPYQAAMEAADQRGQHADQRRQAPGLVAQLARTTGAAAGQHAHAFKRQMLTQLQHVGTQAGAPNMAQLHALTVPRHTRKVQLRGCGCRCRIGLLVPDDDAIGLPLRRHRVQRLERRLHWLGRFRLSASQGRQARQGQNHCQLGRLNTAHRTLYCIDDRVASAKSVLR